MLGLLGRPGAPSTLLDDNTDGTVFIAFLEGIVKRDYPESWKELILPHYEKVTAIRNRTTQAPEQRAAELEAAMRAFA